MSGKVSAERLIQPQDEFCRAITQRATPVTAYLPGQLGALVIAKADGEFICTQDTAHQGSHAACDGRGHILVRWPRQTAERYWQAADCESHGHG
jgi:hypothetical protein